MNLILWIIIGAIALIVLLVIGVYNSFIRLKNDVENSFAQIDVQLKRRNDLIPNLVETVKGYARHEKQLFENVTKARTAIMQSSSMADKAKASNQLSETLKSIFAVAENYPTLRASENFRQLQEELTATEDKIGYSRQYYNDRAMVFNIKCETFPTNFIAKQFSFVKKELFKAAEDERKPVKVVF